MSLKHLIISDFGTFLSKKSERLVVRKEGKVCEEIPFFKIQQVTLAGKGIALSTDLVQELSEHGIQINFLTSSGRPYAKLSSPALSATVDTRREQLIAYNDERAIIFIKRIVAAKLTNQINLLRYFAKYRKKIKKNNSYENISNLVAKMQEIATTVSLIKGKNIDYLRQAFLSIEAKVAKLYWKGVKVLIEDKVEFPGREHEGATDPVNSALNYGYGFLYNQIWSAVLLAGLEPFAGFLHTDRPGKPSLVLDLIEEFRQPVVDRLVISQINKGKVYRVEEGRLHETTRKELAESFKDELNRRVKFGNKKQSIANIIQIQARNVASFLRKQTNYRPFTMKW